MKIVTFHNCLLLLALVLIRVTEANRGWGGANRFKTGGSSGGHRGFQKPSQTDFVFPYSNNNLRPSSNKFDWSNRNNNEDNENLNSGKNTPVEDTPPPGAECVIPPMRDESKVELRCILVDSKSDKDEDCSTLGPMLSSGSVVMSKCKSPYISETGETRLWTCDDGVWKGEFKALQCVARDQVEKVTPKPIPSWLEKFKPQQNTNQEDRNKHNSNSEDFNVWDDLFPETFSSQSASEKTKNNPNDDWSPPPWRRPKPVSKPKPTEKPNRWRPFEEVDANLGWNWQSTTTTTSTTIRPATTAPYDPTPGPDILEGVKCPSLNKRPGFQLKCVSKISLPWAPSSFVVTEGECDTPQPVGSQASYQCEKYYTASGALKTLYRRCRQSGTWSGNAELFSCSLECGVPNPAGYIPLITHGEPTYKGQWPWHAALYYRDTDQQPFMYNCGGVLINKRTVLTAVHCLVETGTSIVKNVTGFRIDLGRYERNVDDEYVQSFSVEEIIIHPDYNPFSYDSDIAIIVLKSSVQIGYHVRPACYPRNQNAALEDAHLASGSIGTAVGFGKNEDDVEATVLHMAKLKVISSKECALTFADTTFGSALAKSSTFCAGLQNGTNVCGGDSGGGIYFPTSSFGSTRWYLLGLVSVGVQSQDGSKRCDPTRYSVFTKISPFADWLDQILSEYTSLYY